MSKLFWIRNNPSEVMPIKNGEVVTFAISGEHKFVVNYRTIDQNGWYVSDCRSGYRLSGPCQTKHIALQKAERILQKKHKDLKDMSELAYQRNKEIIDKYLNACQGDKS